MPSIYPTALDAITNPTTANTLASVPHDAQHSTVNDAVEAIEAKLGTGASTPTTTGHVLKVTGVGATAFGALTSSDVSGVATSAEVVARVEKANGGKEMVNTVAASGTSLSLNLASGNFHDVTLTGNCTLSLAGATNGVACSMTLLLRQDGTGGRTVTWPGSVAWPAGASPTLSSTPGAVNVVTLFTLDGGTTWFGFHAVEDPSPFSLAGMTIERSLQAVSDYVAGYDSSASDERGFPVGSLRLGRGHTVIADELFMSAATDMFEGGCSIWTSGAGAAATLATATVNHPGIVSLATGSTATGYCVLGNPNGTLVLLGGGKVRFGIVAQLPVLSTGTETYTARFGITEAFGGDPVDGVYFRYTDGTNGGRWQGVARSNSVESTVDTGIAANTSFHTFEFEVNAAGTSVTFYIDGTSVGTISTNIPTGTGRTTGFIPAGIVKSVGTTARTLNVDAYWGIFEFTTAR